eukprot:UN13038
MAATYLSKVRLRSRKSNYD